MVEVAITVPRFALLPKGEAETDVAVKRQELEPEEPLELEQQRFIAELLLLVGVVVVQTAQTEIMQM